MAEYLSSILDSLASSAVVYSPRILVGLAILALGWFLSSWAVRTANRVAARTGAVDRTIQGYIAKVLRVAILAVAVIAALSSFGVQTASIIAVLGAAGLALGLALQGMLSNVAFGLVLLALRPFRVEETVQVAGTTGTVKDVGLFATQLQTPDGLFVLIPNAKVWGDVITNLDRNGIRRVDLTFSSGVALDLDRAVAIIREVIVADARVLGTPALEVFAGELTPGALAVFARAWTRVESYQALKVDLTRRVKVRLDAEGFVPPPPRHEVCLVEGKKP